MLKVPIEALSDEALIGVIDAFILREGTDYGHVDYSMDAKRESVRQMLDVGKAEILYYPESEHIDIVEVGSG